MGRNTPRRLGPRPLLAARWLISPGDGMSGSGMPIAVFRGLVIACLALILAGCSEEFGPVRLRLTRVNGVVRQGRVPLSGGWIEFIPVDGTVGNLRSAKVRADGRFEADRVAVGKNLIRLINAPIESRGAAALFSTFSSPIRRNISEQPAEPLDIDLVQETMRFAEARSRAASADAG